MDKERLYKIPCNGDVALVDRMNELEQLGFFKKKNIFCIYIACFKEDGRCTREIDVATSSIKNYVANTWEEYVEKIKYIQDNGYDVEVLFQQPNLILTEDTARRYYDLGIRKFVVFREENAKLLKSLFDDVWVTASITMVLSPDDIKSLPPAYDEVCLYFYYVRNISQIKELPKHFKYSIITHNACSSKCTMCYEHWYADELIECPYRSFNPAHFEASKLLYEVYERAQINYQDLEYFDPYIYSYKIQGREECIEDAITYLLEVVKWPEQAFDMGTPFIKPRVPVKFK